MDSTSKPQNLTQPRPLGPNTWPPKHAWPTTVHTGVNTLKAVARHWNIAPQSTRPLLIAVSGGADSLALAVLASETQRVTGINFGAIILNHQLQDVTDTVTTQTAKVCATLGLEPVETQTVSVQHAGEGLEAAARTARYEAFVRYANSVHAFGVLTAHTAQDQAEQVLLGLARGSGLRSIAGIRAYRSHEITGQEPVQIGRPLLALTREHTEQICAWAGIAPWDDPMNDDDSIMRIRVRKHLLPALMNETTGLGAGVFSGLVTTASLAADDADALEAIAWETYRTLAVEKSDQLSFALHQLQELHPAILRRVLALAVQHFGAPHPTFERLNAIDKLIFPPVGRASSAGPIQCEGHVSIYRKKAGEEYAKLLVIPS